MSKKLDIAVTERKDQYDEHLRALLDAEDIFRPVKENVKIKDAKKWALRWVNTGHQNQAHLRDIKNIGYINVAQDELDCPLQDFGGSLGVDGAIVTGVRGEEVLMKVPAWYYAARQTKKAMRNLDTLTATRMKQSVVDRVGSQLGEDAAGYINKNVRAFDVTDARGGADE